ncbi:MAG: hypothetical protein DWI00_07825 [Planctomycetota bacterium]|nr:MAG: hypothetical protein DWI00_07825 [Planctomycetota bacterium]
MAIVTCVVTKLAGVTEPVSADTSILAKAESSASANAKIYELRFPPHFTENVGRCAMASRTRSGNHCTKAVLHPQL